MNKSVALTGGSGFVGGHLLTLLLAQGIAVRVLTRRAGTFMHPLLTWVSGDLNEPKALTQLLDGSDMVFHLAGVIKGFSRNDYVCTNVGGTHALLAASAQARITRLVHVSSLAARQPTLSDYASSKAAAEQLVSKSNLAWTIVRPPAVYGPGDRETLAMFRAARWPILPVSAPAALLSLIHVEDLATALLAATAPPLAGLTIEVSDGAIVSQRELALMIASAVGNKPQPVTTPRPIATAAARLAELWGRLRGVPPIFNRQKINELYHTDWSVTDSTLSDCTGWRATVPLANGLVSTATWYRAHQWL